MILETKQSDKRINTFFLESDPNEILSNIIGERFKEYRSKWDDSCRFTKSEHYPIHVDFEASNTCNMRCKICILGMPEGRVFLTQKLMQTETIKHIINEGVDLGLRSIGHYYNEILLRPDIMDIYSYALKKGIVDIWLTTNGLLLNEKTSRKILELQIPRLNVSIDAFTPKTYKELRGHDINIVKNNLLNFIKLKKEGNFRLPLVRVSFVRTSLNENEIEDFKTFWSQIVDYVTIQEYVSSHSKLDIYHPTKRQFVEKKEFKCSLPFQRATIRPNGDVLPCCNVYSIELVMGNITKKTLSEIWNDEPFRDLRSQHLNEQFASNPICNKCMSCWVDI